MLKIPPEAGERGTDGGEVFSGYKTIQRVLSTESVVIYEMKQNRFGWKKGFRF